MPVDPAGVAIGVGALLLAFKGAVDSFVLIDAIVEADNGERYLGLKYFIERRKLEVWSDHFMLEKVDTSPLRHETDDTRKLIAGILAEIQAVNGSAKRYLKRYDMQPSKVGTSSVMDKMVKAIKAERDYHGQSHRFRWATRDKAKFGELVTRLGTLVADLQSISRVDRDESLDRALLVYVLSSISDHPSLNALQTSDTGAGPLISLAAHIKQLQILESGSSSATEVREFDLQGLAYNEEGNSEPGERLPFYLSNEGALDQRAWVEWKIVSPTLDPSDQEKIIDRIKSLGKILSATKPTQFRVPRCLGIAQDNRSLNHIGVAPTSIWQLGGQRLGYIYSYPGVQYDEQKKPVSLLELLENRRETPLLNDRFELAYHLASSMSLFHATRWLHKGYRSSNILFFHPINGPFSLTDPYVTGFDHSRPEGPIGSIESVVTGDPEIDLYYHPNTRQGFNRLRDFYSLGVVLFEIALWRPFHIKIPKDKKRPLKDLPMDDIYHLLLDSIPSLGGVMGATYRDVVRLCLKGDFGIVDDADGIALGRAFFQRVVRELDRCRM